MSFKMQVTPEQYGEILLLADELGFRPPVEDGEEYKYIFFHDHYEGPQWKWLGFSSSDAYFEQHKFREISFDHFVELVVMKKLEKSKAVEVLSISLIIILITLLGLGGYFMYLIKAIGG